MKLIEKQSAISRMCGINCGCTRDMCGYGDSGCARVQFVEEMPTVDAIPIEPLAVWLAGYRASPPEYALIQAGAYDEIDPASVVYTASQSAKAWAYHLRKLMESGLMDG